MVTHMNMTFRCTSLDMIFKASTLSNFVCMSQTLGKGAKKAVTTDEWRKKSVEERLEHSLVKVSRKCKVHVE